MKHVEILIDDPGFRFRAGEIGHVLENTFEKYDYFVQLSPIIHLKNGIILRHFYFTKDEVKEL